LAQGRAIEIATIALAQHRRIGNEAECGERTQLRVGGTWNLAWRIQVLDPHQPLPVRMSRQQPAAQCRQQRAEMQRPGRRGRKATAIRW
jgi:hypothetical protein